MASFHAIKYDLLKDNLSNQVNFVDSYESILEALEGAPLSNEVEETIQNIKTKIDDSKVIITNLKKTITEIDDLKDKFKDQLEVPKSGNNKKFNMEHLLISVPQFDDTNEKIPFQHFFKKLTCFARNNSLTHEAIKQCLDIVLKANAFDIYDFVRQEPLSKVISILSDHFGSITNLDDDIRKLASIKRKPEQKVQSFMAEVSLLLLKTESLTDPQARDQRYESKMKEHLFQACSETAKNKLDNFMAEAIRNGIRPTYKELFHIVKEHEREQQYSQHQDIANYTLMLTRNKNKNKNNDDLSSNTYRETSYSPSEASYQSSRRSSRSSRSTRPEPSSYQIHEARFITERRPNLLENRQAQVFTDANGIKWVKKKEQQDHLISEDEDTYKENRINEKPHQIKTKLHTTDQHYDRDRSPLRTPTEYLNTNEKPPQEIQHQRDSQPKNQYEIIPPPKTEKIPVRISRPSSITSRGPSPIASSTNSTPSRRSSTSESQSPQKMSVITNFFPHLYHGVETIKCKSCGEVHYLISGCKNPKSAHTLLLSCLKQDPNNYDVRTAYYTNLPNSINGENGNNLQNDICSDQSEEDSEMSDHYTESQDTDSDIEMNCDTQPIHYQETTSNHNKPNFLTKEEFYKHKEHEAQQYCGLISHKLPQANVEKNIMTPNIQTLIAKPFGGLAGLVANDDDQRNFDCPQIRGMIPVDKKVEIKVNIQIDTGSSVSIINDKFLETFPHFHFQQKDDVMTYNTLSNKHTTTRKSITIPIILDNKKKYMILLKVVEGSTLPFQIILGRDFIEKKIKTLNIKDKTIKLECNDTLHLENPINTSENYIESVEEKYIAPRQATHIKVKANQYSPGTSNINSITQLNIITKTFKNTKSQIHGIRVENPTKTAIHIAPGDTIALLDKNDHKDDYFSIEEILQEQMKDDSCNKIRCKGAIDDNYKIINNLLTKKVEDNYKIYLPKRLLYKLFSKLHDHTSGKPQEKGDIINIFHEKYYRPDLGRLIKKAIENCPNCWLTETQVVADQPEYPQTFEEKIPDEQPECPQTPEIQETDKDTPTNTQGGLYLPPLTSFEHVYLPPSATRSIMVRMDIEGQNLKNQKILLKQLNSAVECITKSVEFNNSSLYIIQIRNPSPMLAVSIKFKDPLVIPLITQDCQTKPRERVRETFKEELTDDNGSDLYLTPLTNKITKPESDLNTGRGGHNHNKNTCGSSYEKYPTSLKRKHNEMQPKRYKRHKSANKQTRQPQRPFFHLGEVVYYRNNYNYDGPYQIRHISRSMAFLRHIFNRNKTLKCHLRYLLKSI